MKINKTTEPQKEKEMTELKILPDKHGFKGSIQKEVLLPDGDPSLKHGIDFIAMAENALKYLANNPDPAHDYQSRFSYYLLLYPPFSPEAYESGARKTLRLKGVHVDPIVIGDTENGNDIAFNQMREMTGATTHQNVQDIVHKRLLGYVKSGKGGMGDDMCWCIPTCMSTMTELEHAMEWTTCRLLQSEVDLWRLTKKKNHRLMARRLFDGLRRPAAWETGRAFYREGVKAFRDGKYLGAYGGHYPHLLTPLVNYWETTGETEALEFACAMADGMLADLQPGNLHHAGGYVGGHCHNQAYALRGLAQLGAAMNNWRYLEWAENVYKFFALSQMNTGWLPEIINEKYSPAHRNHAETCFTADIMEMECWFARGGKPDYWDQVERTIRNYLAPLQWQVTPQMEELYKQIHAKRSFEEIRNGMDQLRQLEGGFLSGPTPNDRIFEVLPGSEHHGGIDFQGSHIVMDMMGCCPPEGMRMLYLAWKNTICQDGKNVFVNLAFNHDGPIATVKTTMPGAGQISAKAKMAANFLLRPPAWVQRGMVGAFVDGKPIGVRWGGPAFAYIDFPNIHPGQTVEITWPLVSFSQRISEQYIGAKNPDPHSLEDPLCEGNAYAFDWIGNVVKSVEPQGRWLPLF